MESGNGAGGRRQGSGDTFRAGAGGGGAMAYADVTGHYPRTSQGPSCQLAGLLLGHWCLVGQLFPALLAGFQPHAKRKRKKKFQVKTSQEPVCMQLFYIHQQLLPTILLLLNY